MPSAVWHRTGWAPEVKLKYISNATFKYVTRNLLGDFGLTTKEVSVLYKLISERWIVVSHTGQRSNQPLL